MDINLKKYKIGIIPNSPNFDHPQDRRRYVPYLMENGLSFEKANYEKDYDILYISLSADLNQWCNYKKKQRAKNLKVRIILDLSDLYLVESGLNDFLRSIYHYWSGRTSILKISYKKSIEDMIDNADILICGSIEQSFFLKKYNKSIFVIRDYFDDEVHFIKKNYALAKAKELNILWEGFSHGSKIYFKMLKRILDPIDEFKIHLHIMTDPEYCLLGAKHFRRSTYSMLKNIFENTNISFHLYDWNSIMFNAIAINCDLALIPIPNEPLARSKPENKLILLWLLGLPVVTSDIPSYNRVIRDINMEWACDNYSTWRDKIRQLASSQEIRENYMANVKKYINNHYSKNLIFLTYEKIFFEQ